MFSLTEQLFFGGDLLLVCQSQCMKGWHQLQISGMGKMYFHKAAQVIGNCKKQKTWPFLKRKEGWHWHLESHQISNKIACYWSKAIFLHCFSEGLLCFWKDTVSFIWICFYSCTCACSCFLVLLFTFVGAGFTCSVTDVKWFVEILHWRKMWAFWATGENVWTFRNAVWDGLIYLSLGDNSW